MYPSETSFPRLDFETVIRDHLAWLESTINATYENRGVSPRYRNGLVSARDDLRGRLA